MPLYISKSDGKLRIYGCKSCLEWNWYMSKIRRPENKGKDSDYPINAAAGATGVFEGIQGKGINQFLNLPSRRKNPDKNGALKRRKELDSIKDLALRNAKEFEFITNRREFACGNRSKCCFHKKSVNGSTYGFGYFLCQFQKGSTRSRQITSVCMGTTRGNGKNGCNGLAHLICVGCAIDSYIASYYANGDGEEKTGTINCRAHSKTGLNWGVDTWIRLSQLNSTDENCLKVSRLLKTSFFYVIWVCIANYSRLGMLDMSIFDTHRDIFCEVHGVLGKIMTHFIAVPKSVHASHFLDGTVFDPSRYINWEDSIQFTMNDGQKTEPFYRNMPNILLVGYGYLFCVLNHDTAPQELSNSAQGYSIPILAGNELIYDLTGLTSQRDVRKQLPSTIHCEKDQYGYFTLLTENYLGRESLGPGTGGSAGIFYIFFVLLSTFIKISSPILLPVEKLLRAGWRKQSIALSVIVDIPRVIDPALLDPFKKALTEHLEVPTDTRKTQRLDDVRHTMLEGIMRMKYPDVICSYPAQPQSESTGDPNPASHDPMSAIVVQRQ